MLVRLTFCSKMCPISSFHNGFCLCRLCTVVWHMLAMWGSSQEWSPRASPWLWMREVGIACFYNDLSMSQYSQTSILWDNCSTYNIRGNGFLKYGGLSNTMKWKKCLSVQYTLTQYTFYYSYKKLSTPVYLCFRSGSLVGEFYYWSVRQKSYAYQFLNARCE